MAQAVAILIVTGVAWIAVIVSLNAATQAFLPDWVRARALAVYQMVMFGSFAASAALWGALATWLGTAQAFALAGGVLVVLTVAGQWLPLLRSDIGDRTAVPMQPLPVAESLTGVGRDDPLEIVVEYRVAVAEQPAFLETIGALRTSRLRTGAHRWVLLRDAEDQQRFIERYRVASWSEHDDQHQRRLTPFDLAAEQRVADHTEVVAAARHLLVVDVPHHRNRTTTEGTS
jgi:hypothetical protein